MAMSYSMNPEEVFMPAANARRVDAGSTGTDYYFAPLSKLEDIANKFGADFYAEITSVSGTWLTHSGTSKTFKSGASIPTLRSIRYPNLAFYITGVNEYLQNAAIVVLDLNTHEPITINTCVMINKNEPYFDVYSFNSKLQALSGCADKGFIFGQVIIFGEDYIFMTNDFTSTQNAGYMYLIIRADNSWEQIYCPSDINCIGYSRTDVDPLLDPSNPDRVFKGLGCWFRGADLIFHRETHGGKMYIIFGNDATQWSQIERPHFVISSDVL